MKKRDIVRYEIDPHNRLIYKKTGRESEVPGFRAVLDGTFEIDKNNYLTYHVKKSQISDNIPQQLKLKGTWSLDKEHNLVFTLDKWGNQIAGNKLTIEGELMGADADMLSFMVTSKDSDRKEHIYIIKLSGRWQADKYNRLSFDVEKEKGPTDRITFRGSWEINKQNEIIYTYEKPSRANTITLKGYWDIGGKHRIIYVLNKELKSEFDFKVSVGKSADRGLEYEIGIGAVPAKKAITLFGSWKLSPKIGLLFEMPSADGKINSIVLGAWGKLDKNYNLEIRLENKRGEDLGVDVKLSRKILQGQGEAFIRTLSSRKEVSIVAGVGFRW
ncbi:MAG: hypothetical protein Q8L26_04540 [Candidatus Omnitrophota bacterium]|nr:hypothetical protein [Candidatus Omnitrophota bacterium]